MAPSAPAKELPDELVSDAGAGPATTLSQFQIFSPFLVALPNSKCKSYKQNQFYLLLLNYLLTFLNSSPSTFKYYTSFTWQKCSF